jgi:hypothetical protein
MCHPTIKVNYRWVKCLITTFALLFTINNFLSSQNLYDQFSGKEYWHSQLSEHLNIRKDRLKLSQGYIIVENKSYWLWNMFNSMPGSDSGIYYNFSQFNQFSSGFMTMLYNFPISDTFDPECNLNDAILKFIAAKDTYPWDKPIQDLYSELAGSGPFVLKSDTTIIIQGDNDAVQSYTIRIEAHYEKMVVFYSYPYSKKNDRMDSYSPWHTPCILKKSYDDSIYWESTFGAGGFMHYMNVALIIVQNGSTTISVLTDSGDFSDTATSSVPIVLAVVVFTIEDFIQNTP